MKEEKTVLSLQEVNIIMRKVFLIILCLSIFYSCKLKENDKLDIYVESEYAKNGENCVIDFNKILDYDKIYIFGIGVSNIEVSKKIGFEYEGDKDISRLILFVKNKSIIYEQNNLFSDKEPYKIVFKTDLQEINNRFKFKINEDIEREGIYILTPFDSNSN